VVNHSGPQCNGGLDPASQNSYKLSSNENSIGQKPDVYERISNLEKCLNFKNDNDIDIYKKLKSIEDHVLKLENMLLNTGKFSLSSICSNDNQPMEIVNHNLKIDINNIQVSLDCEKFILIKKYMVFTMN
jgi:predicted acetyltransferase